MKMKYHIILTCSLIVAFFVARHLYTRPTPKGDDGNVCGAVAVRQNERETAVFLSGKTPVSEKDAEPQATEMAGEEEPWIRPLDPNTLVLEGEQIAKVLQLSGTLMAENELRIMEKYAGWTDEEIAQRKQELEPRSGRTEEQAVERWEFYTLDVALRRAKERANPPSRGLGREGIEKTMVDTEEYKKFDQIRRYVHNTRFREDSYGKVRMEEADIEFLNRIIERLNQTAKTNELLRTYWDYRRRQP